MLLNGKNINNETIIETDICIVGSGMGGSTMAIELAKHNKSFILIEAGDKNKNTNVVNHENIGHDFKMPTTRSIELGGTSTLWGGGLTPLDKNDFEKKDYIPNSGWPISLDELLPFYKRAGDIFNLKDFNYFYENSISKKFQKEIKDIKFNKNKMHNKFFQIPLPIFNFKPVLIDLFESSAKFNCYYNSTALELIEEKGKISELIVGIDSGTFIVKAKKIIICAGALETPRLLLNSKLSNNNIGKYLMDHPKGYLSQLDMKASGIPKNHIYAFMKYDGDNMQIKTGLLINEEVQKDEKIYNHHIYIKPIVNNLNIMRNIEKLGIIIHTFKNSKDKLKDISYLLRNFTTLLRGVAYKFDFSALYKKTGIFLIAEQIPNKDSFVSLSNKKDKWGYFIAKVNWQLHKDDISNITKYFDYIKSSLNYPIKDFKYGLVQDKDDWIKNFSSAAHHCGTARMSDSTTDGVVDKNLKVFNKENLYVCDASVFTTSGNANSAFTISALAVRLVEHIMEN
jgi:hypothetical protein